MRASWVSLCKAKARTEIILVEQEERMQAQQEWLWQERSDSEEACARGLLWIWTAGVHKLSWGYQTLRERFVVGKPQRTCHHLHKPTCHGHHKYHQLAMVLNNLFPVIVAGQLLK